ncbi:ras-associated and pleckstrin homology domains-containing protein 1-like isoform X3 [Ptychodera flava]
MDSDQEEDLDKMLGTWLGELENMTKQLGGSDDNPSIPLPVPATPPPPTPSLGNLDNFRFSMANLEARMQQMKPQESQDVDLDALLGDLCQMEKDLEWQADQQNKNAAIEDLSEMIGQGRDETDSSFTVMSDTGNDDISEVFQPTVDNDNTKTDLDDNINVNMVSPAQSIAAVSEHERSIPTDLPIPSPVSPVTMSTATGTPTPQKESWPTPPPSAIISPVQTTPTINSPQPIATSPTLSSPTTKLLNLQISSPTNTLEKMSRSVRIRLESLQDNLDKEELPEDEKIARVKAEKIRIALEKLKEARIRKLIIRVFTEDGSSKTVLVDENMTSRDVCHLLVEKNHYEETPNWVLVERLPDIHMERIPEDHEHLVTDVLLLWPRETNNTILFMEKREKYALFKNPQHYLLSTKSSNTAQEFAEKTKQDLIDEFFLSGANSVVELEGFLFLKAEGKKSWKKHFCMLRGSGIYYCPKGKSKSLKDLVCYVQFEHVNVYNGVGWKKKYKAPTDFCFALKHPQIMQKSKYIKYMCAEDYRTAQRWITGIRIAKHGKQLYSNYEQTLKEMSDYTSNLGSMRSSDTSSMASVQSSSSSQGSQSSQGSTHTSVQSSPASQSSGSSINSQAPPTPPPKTKTNLRFNATRNRTPIPECMSTSVYNNTKSRYQETSGTGSMSGRSNTISHPHKSVSDVFASAWKKGSELQQQQQKEDRMSMSSVTTVDSEISEPKSQSSRSSSMSISNGSTNSQIWQRDIPHGRQTVTGVPLQGILKPSPQSQKFEQPVQHVDMDIQSQLLQLELDLEKQSSQSTVSQPGFPTTSSKTLQSDGVDGNANQVPVTTVKVMAKDRQAVSVTVKPPTGLTKHESLKKSKPPPPPKRSAETMSRSASVGNYKTGISPTRESQKRVQFKDDPQVDRQPPSAMIPTLPPPTDSDLPPPPFPSSSQARRVTTPTTPSFPSPPPPLTPTTANVLTPTTPDYPAPPPLSASSDKEDITPMSRPKSSSAGEIISSLNVNPGFLADLQKAVKSQPQVPSPQYQQQQDGKKPPPPPKRSGGSISKGKKMPPPPPQRFT